MKITKNKSRANTRYSFSQGFRAHGLHRLSVEMMKYHVGDIVHIRADSGKHLDLPDRKHHGKTGTVCKVGRRGVSVSFKLKDLYGKKVEVRPFIGVSHVFPAPKTVIVPEPPIRPASIVDPKLTQVIRVRPVSRESRL